MVNNKPVRLLVAAATLILLSTSQLAHAAPVPTFPAAAPGSYHNDFHGFYTVPQKLPDQPGTLLRIQHFTASPKGKVEVPEQELPIKGTRLMFTTRLVNGKMGYSTAAFLRANVKWSHGTPRPLVIHGPGTLGQGDQCTASKTSGQIFSSRGERFSYLKKDAEPYEMILNYESITSDKLLDDGYDVLTVDYTGSSEGIQSYINNIEAGRVMLDAVRALRQLGAITTTTPVTALGYSQGGSAVALAATLQPSYAPDVKLAAAVLGAPPLDLIEVSKQIDGSSMTGLIGYAINGYAIRYPQMRRVLDSILNEEGRNQLEAIKGTCIMTNMMSTGFSHTTEWTRDGRPIYQYFQSNPIVRKLLQEQLTAAYTTPEVPILMSANPYDDVVAFNQVRNVARRWCAAGARVQFLETQFKTPLHGVGLHHIIPGFALIVPAKEFFQQVLTGQAPTRCGSSVMQIPSE